MTVMTHMVIIASQDRYAVLSFDRARTFRSMYCGTGSCLGSTCRDTLHCHPGRCELPKRVAYCDLRDVSNFISAKGVTEKQPKNTVMSPWLLKFLEEKKETYQLRPVEYSHQLATSRVRDGQGKLWIRRSSS